MEYAYIIQVRTVAKFRYELSNKQDTRNLFLSEIKRNIRRYGISK